MPTSTAHILVVDDNPATRYSTCRVLRNVGWTVIEAENGLQALERARADIDLIILDVHLPDIDGFEVCRRLRAQPATERTPVVHLSATFVNDAHKVHGLESGADGYLTHPVEPPVLIATVNAFLRTRKAESELRQSEARFKAVFENALNGVALLDENASFVDANPAFCRLLGQSRELLLKRSLRQFVPADRIAEFEGIDIQLATHHSWRGVLPLTDSSGGMVYLEWHVSAHNMPGLRLAIVSDITDRLEYEREREELLWRERAARADAEQANKQKDDFLATLSHELRTPLNAIVGWSHLLQMGLSSAETQEGLQAIDRNANALAQMIADLLDVSRITSGKIRLDLQPLDPAAVIEAALSAALPLAEAKSIRITSELNARGAMIQGDPSRLQQVLSNLLNNAIKFTPPSGRIGVALSRGASHVEIRVADNGQGIEPGYLSQIFERFRQEDESSTREHAGLGLGLAIAKQLMELHGGAISAESPGKGLGSTFIVTIPCMVEPTTTSEVSPTPSLAPFTATRLSGIRVLVVEDDPDARILLKRIIGDCGADVRETSSVVQALDVLGNFAPDIIVSDLGMPGRDGYDLIREVRSREDQFQRIPAVALTAFARAEDRQRCLEAGFQVHMAKPVNARELIRVVASLLGRSVESR